MDEVGDQVVPGGVDFHNSRIHTKGGEPAREALDFRYELTDLLPEHPTLGRVLRRKMAVAQDFKPMKQGRHARTFGAEPLFVGEVILARDPP